MLVLAMEFSRDARRPDSEKYELGGRTNTRAADLSEKTIGIATEVKLSLPQNGIVRSGIPPRPGIRGRPGTPPKGHGRTAAAGKRKKAE